MKRWTARRRLLPPSQRQMCKEGDGGREYYCLLEACGRRRWEHLLPPVLRPPQPDMAVPPPAVFHLGACPPMIPRPAAAPPAVFQSARPPPAVSPPAAVPRSVFCPLAHPHAACRRRRSLRCPWSFGARPRGNTGEGQLRRRCPLAARRSPAAAPPRARPKASVRPSPCPDPSARPKPSARVPSGTRPKASTRPPHQRPAPGRRRHCRHTSPRRRDRSRRRCR